MSNDTIGSNPGDNTIAWTYDGNTVINSPCEATQGSTISPDIFTDIDGDSNQHCGIKGDIVQARKDQFIKIISGPYGCTDRTSRGVTATSMVVVLGKAANLYIRIIKYLLKGYNYENEYKPSRLMILNVKKIDIESVAFSRPTQTGRNDPVYTGWPEKVCYYQESSRNYITVREASFFINFEPKNIISCVNILCVS